MANTTTVQARVSADDKTEAQATLKALGLDLSTYINMSIKALNRNHGVPFDTTLKPSAALETAIKNVKAGHVTKPVDLDEYLTQVDGYDAD
jgi:addiction module RelB/DinJ family antitoxin